jgi:hypothetical protein
VDHVAMLYKMNLKKIIGIISNSIPNYQVGIGCARVNLIKVNQGK